jgi:hypothetical protein
MIHVYSCWLFIAPYIFVMLVMEDYKGSSLCQWYSTGGTRRHLRGYVDYTICITCIMYQQLWGYKVEEELCLGAREQKRLNTTALCHGLYRKVK